MGSVIHHGDVVFQALWTETSISIVSTCKAQHKFTVARFQAHGKSLGFENHPSPSSVIFFMCFTWWLVLVTIFSANALSEKWFQVSFLSFAVLWDQNLWEKSFFLWFYTIWHIFLLKFLWLTPLSASHHCIIFCRPF